MNNLVYLPEFDSVRTSPQELLLAKQALFEELINKGNNVVFSFNQIADSQNFMSLLGIYRPENETVEDRTASESWDEVNFEALYYLFKKGYLRVSNFGTTRTASQYIQGSIDRCLADASPEDKENTFIFSFMQGICSEEQNKQATPQLNRAALQIVKQSLFFSDPKIIDKYKDSFGNESNAKVIKRYVQFILAISSTDAGHNPTKFGPKHSFCEYGDNDSGKGYMNILLENRSKLTDDDASYLKIMHQALDILDILQAERIKAKNIMKRSVWLMRLWEWAQEATEKGNLPEKPRETLRLAESIINLCYNYTIEDSISNVSKAFPDEPQAFLNDFCQNLRIFWREYLAGMHCLEADKLDAEGAYVVLKKLDPANLAEWNQAWTTAVRLVKAKKDLDHKDSISQQVQRKSAEILYWFKDGIVKLWQNMSLEKLCSILSEIPNSVKMYCEIFAFIGNNLWQRYVVNKSSDNSIVNWQKYLNLYLTKRFMLLLVGILFFCIISSLSNILQVKLEDGIKAVCALIHWNINLDDGTIGGFIYNMLVDFFMITIACEVFVSLVYDQVEIAQLNESIKGIKQNYKDWKFKEKQLRVDLQDQKNCVYVSKQEEGVPHGLFFDTRWKKYKELMQSRPECFATDKTDGYHLVLPNGQYPVDAENLNKLVSGERIVEEFELNTGQKIGVVYESKYNTMVVDLVYTKPGIYFAYERLLARVAKGAVVALAFHEDNIILLHQFRHATRKYEYALVRGFGEENITAEENLAKELAEEIGAKEVTQVQLLGKIKTDTGITNKEVEIYSCQVAEYAKDTADCYEGIERIQEISISEFENWIREGKIQDDFTIEAYALWKLFHAVV